MVLGYPKTNAFRLPIRWNLRTPLVLSRSEQSAKVTRLPPNLASPTLFPWFGEVYSMVLVYLKTVGDAF